MDGVDLDDEDSLRGWLSSKPRTTNTLIAFRMAMRRAPARWATMIPVDPEIYLTPLVSLRPLILSQLASRWSTPQINDLISDAVGDAGRSAETEAEAAAYSALLSPSNSAVATASLAWGGINSLAAPSDWSEISNDVLHIEAGRNLHTLPLWHNRDSTGDVWKRVRSDWERAGAHWNFWIYWYEDVLAGRPANWKLITDICTSLSDEDWLSGPDKANALIAGIVGRHSSRRLPRDEVSDVLYRAAPTAEAAETVLRAMEVNRHSLPQTLDGIEALILLEIERLQKDNYLNATVPEECKRQIGNYLVMYEAIQALKARVPTDAPTTPEAAAECESLVKLYWKKFRELPRAKADSVVEGVWQTGVGIVQGGLILASTSLAVSYGVPAYAGVATGALLFAPQRAGEIVKAAREILPKL